MRESFGGTMMITILMVFIVIFISFTAVIVNVAKTFRIKNAVINYVEQYQYDGTDDGEDGVIEKIDSYLGRAGYSLSSTSNLSTDAKNTCTTNGGKWYDKGYCIADNGNYYTVTVYVYVDLPFFGVNLYLPISGETKSYYDLA